MKKIIIPLFLILATSFMASAEVILINVGQPLDKQFIKTNVTYYINNFFDLDSETLLIPNGCILRFSDQGRFSNGTIIGANTNIEASQHLIFDDIQIKGEWKITTVYSEWVNLVQGEVPNNKQFQNLMTLCKGSELTHLYTERGEFSLNAVNNSAPIIVPSNIYWHNSSTLKLRGCNYSKYSLVLLNKVENVTIDGGLFVGDILEHTGTDGEWGHGIKCGGSKNINLRNLECRNFWGDGIDLIEGMDSHNKPSIVCDSIKIHNVKCLYNRRQGLSIEAAHNVHISNSKFSYTGNIKKTNPSAGIDIEPWDNDGKKISNIIIEDCVMENNSGPDLMVYIPSHLNAQQNFNVSIINCVIGFSFLYRVAGVSFEKCNITNVLRVDFSDYIKTDSYTRIKRKSIKGNGSNIFLNQ